VGVRRGARPGRPAADDDVAQGPAVGRGGEGRPRDEHDVGGARPSDEREQPSPPRGEGQRGAPGRGPDPPLAVPQSPGQ
jgi:hypothetical protein